LQVVAVEPDELAQEADRQQVVAALLLFLDDDLGQDRAGDVVAGLGVEDDEVLAVLHHLAEMVERDVARRRGVVEPAVGVFLDRDG
jgi:cyanate lyase